MGSTSYYSRPNSDLRTQVPYMVDFTASRATRTTIFRLAEQLHFFHGDFKTQSALPRTGWKSLTFAEGPINNQVSYTSSQNPLMKRLTSLFERISATMESGRRLSALQSSNRGGLLAELKRMERKARCERLLETQAIAPTLQQLSSEMQIPRIARQYAVRILEETHSEGS
jgi:hypothetical protein